MSHKNTELELCSGVNVLTGPNNSGKSALVTALQLLTELPTREGTYMIRHGEKEAEVTVETSEGDVITWGRKETSSYLVINGERHSRLSNNQEHFLNELHKVLKLPQVKNKEDSFDIHFASQKQPIFLLDDPPSRAATFFSVSSDAGRLVEVRDLFKSKVNKAKEKRNSLDRKLNALKLDLERLAPLKEMDVQISALRGWFDSIEKESQQIVAGFELHEVFKKGVFERHKLLAKHTLHLRVNPPPLFEDVTILEGTIAQIRMLQKREQKLKSDVATLANLKPSFDLVDIQILESSIASLRSFSKVLAEKNRAESIIHKILPPPELVDCAPLEEQVRKQKKALNDTTALFQKVNQARVALEKWIKENPTCPTCGAPLNEEQMLSHE